MTTTSPALKPCPFCGLTPEENSYYADQGNKWGRVVCGCGAYGPDVRTSYDMSPNAPWHADAAKEWNRRAEIPGVASSISRIQHAKAELSAVEDSLWQVLRELVGA